ncbi:MAG: endopeptidase La [Erysipelotrichaceae bacterium]|nr:endopeptidase La [Erysipelotrichaceae bacterium]
MAIIVPVYNSVVLPDSVLYLQTESYRNVTKREPNVGDRLVILVSKQELNKDEYTEDSFYPIGVTGSITEINSQGYIVVHTDNRVSAEELIINDDGTLSADTIIRRNDTDELSPEDEKRKLDAVKAALIRTTQSYNWAPMARGWINGFRSLNDALVATSQWLNMTPEDKYNILEEDSAVKRAEIIEKTIYEYTAVTDITNEANSAQEAENQKAYREQAIKKQMEYLQKELDEMHPENVSDIRRMEKRVQESGMNETARKEADKVLQRLKTEGQNSPEYGNLYNYLDFMTSLPWKKEKMRKIDIDEARKVLDEDHYGLKKVKERVLEQIAVMDLNRRQSGSILLFVGAPGTGKTSIGKSIAKALHRKYVRVALGGARDEADIRGHRRTYIGAMPGRIMDGIQKAGSSNPVMVLDEVDKLGQSYQGDPASALLEVLDPEQNNTFTDHYLNVPYDLSNVLFICTANTLDSIPAPLLDRMEIIEFSGYTATEKFEIAKRHLIPKAMKKMGIKKGQVVIEDDALRHVISDYTMEGGVRGLKKRIDTIFRAAAVDLARGKKDVQDITPDKLEKYLDMKPIHHEHVTEEKQPGIVTGLAWTQAGGEILFIESLMTKGKGQTIITGQLGDVMKESVQIAVSLVKSMFPDKTEMFEKNDLHVHVPEGAVKKDGPSAGITLTTAISSLVTGKAVSPEFAMTGEVSLRGHVMPIGGLPEKLMAAERAGVKTVFIPQDNVDDLKDVADEVKEKLNIVPVKEVKDVLKAVGILDK